MANHTPVEIDENQATLAQDTWAGFTKLLKYSIYGIAVTLIILALIYIDFF